MLRGRRLAAPRRALTALRTRPTVYAQQHTLLMRCATTASTHKRVLFRELAETFAAIESTRQSRDTSVRLLAAQFHDVMHRSPHLSSELASALYLTASQLAPPHEGVELRFGTRSFAPVVEQLLALQQPSRGATPDAALDVTKFPDFGTAVRSLLDSGRITIPAPSESCDGDDLSMTITFVHDELLRLAREEGSGAVVRKQQRAVQLLQQCRSANELVFLVRMLAHQSLRIGMGEKSILAALAIASASPSSLTSSTETTDIATTPAHRAWVDSVTTAYAQHPDYAALAQLVLASQSESDLAQRVEWLNTRAAPTVGIPVLTMSAYPVASITGVLDRIRKTASQTATCEYKYDGARVQIHLSLRTDAEQHESAIVMGRIFSRNMEDNTEKYRSLLDVLARQLQRHSATAEPPSSPSPQPTRDVILEGEVVAIDRATQRFLPFQVLQTKTTTEFCLFAFDLLHLDGAKLLHRPLRERRALLRACFGEDPGYFEFVKSVDVDVSETSDSSSSDSGDAKDASETLRVRSFLQDAVAAGCEGLMVKALDGDSADYKAGVRSYSWMKVKQDYLTDDTAASSAAVGDSRSKRKAHASIDHGTFLPDTLDLVPVGAFYGKGRRAGVFGSFLLATYNAASCRFETIGKVGTGFSDAQLTEISARLRQQQAVLADDSAVPDAIVSGAIRSRRPDVWLDPSEVWEIKATQLTASPSYTCAASSAEAGDTSSARGEDAAVGKATTGPKGLALRFPRFVRFRTDKKPEQATDSAQVGELFRQQAASQNGEGGSTHA